jgi:hypothetical protein
VAELFFLWFRDDPMQNHLNAGGAAADPCLTSNFGSL